MSTIIFEGNTYTFGATVSANPGTGTTSYVFGGLSSGWTYGFIIWAFNGVGPSSIVGPTIRQTLSVAPLELRDDFGAVAWTWPGLVNTSLDYYYGSDINLFRGSEDFGVTAWGAAGVTRVNSGITLPNGYNHGMIITVPVNLIMAQNIQFLRGLTYYMSWYENETFNSGAQLPVNLYNAGDGQPTGLFLRQILPQESMTFAQSTTINTPIGATAGQTGWVRYAYEMYTTIEAATVVIGFRTSGAWGATRNYYIGAPQLEIGDP